MNELALTNKNSRLTVIDSETGEILSRIESMGWYTALVEECRAIITETEFNSRWALVEGYHELGQRIITDKDFQKHAKGNQSSLIGLSKNIGISNRKLYYAIQFAEKFPDLDLLPEGKNTSWNKVVHNYLPSPNGKLARDEQRIKNQELVAGLPANYFEIGGTVKTIVLDPPWDWGDEGDVDQFGRAKPTYATMPFEKICALPISTYADKNAHIYLWITNRSLPKGFQLLEMWGFRYITCLTWCKPSFGMGNYFRGSTEQVLFGVKGSLPLARHDMGTWFAAPRGDEHSSKPDEFFEIVESCSPPPYLELFARKERCGWMTRGAELE